MIIYNRSKFDRVSKGKLVFVYEWSYAGEYELDGYNPDDRILILSDIVITTEPGNKGVLTGWITSLEAVDPSQRELIEIATEEFMRFFTNEDKYSIDLSKRKAFSHIETIDTFNIFEIKRTIIKSVEVK